MAKIKLTGTAMFARLQESDRDKGNSNTPEHIQQKIDAVGGKYVMNLFFDDSVKRKDLIKAGVPHTGMLGQLIKEDDEGNLFYKCQRNHKRIAQDGKEYIFGPPKVTDADGNDWDFSDGGNGLIGNGSLVEVTLNRWDGNSVTLISMEEVKVLDHVRYERPERPEEEVTSVGGSGKAYTPPADEDTPSEPKSKPQVEDDEIPF